MAHLVIFIMIFSKNAYPKKTLSPKKQSSKRPFLENAYHLYEQLTMYPMIMFLVSPFIIQLNDQFIVMSI